jgi:hypothetical protein
MRDSGKNHKKLSLLIAAAIALIALLAWVFVDHPRSLPANANVGHSAVALPPPPHPHAQHEKATLPPAPQSPAQSLGLTRDRFYMPTIGEVECYSSMRDFTFNARNGTSITLPFKIFQDDKGNFLRAEYVKEGAPNYEATRAVQESNYKVTGQRLAPASQPPSIRLEDLMPRIYEAVEYNGSKENSIAYATRLNISYVQLHNGTTDIVFEAPVFIVNAYGTGKIAMYLPDTELLKRLRFVFDEKGKLLWVDNTL